jgi:hypothetical protein
LLGTSVCSLECVLCTIWEGLSLAFFFHVQFVYFFFFNEMTRKLVQEGPCSTMTVFSCPENGEKCTVACF